MVEVPRRKDQTPRPDQGDSCHPENGKTAGNASGLRLAQGAQTFDVAAGG